MYGHLVKLISKLAGGFCCALSALRYFGSQNFVWQKDGMGGHRTFTEE